MKDVELVWKGKQEMLDSFTKETNKKLFPLKEKSVDWNNTENIYIEGDNLDALKILQKDYVGKIDVIYIDPPYNTGVNRMYKDKWKHSDWLNMMYPRLKLARNLLSDDGVIFVSIDDNEQANLKLLMDDIFGEANLIANMIIDATPKNDPLMISTSHEYVLVYVKDKQIAKKVDWGYLNPWYKILYPLIENKSFSDGMNILRKYYKEHNLSQENISNYKYIDEFGIYRTGPLDDPQGRGPKDERINPKTGETLKVPSRGWSTNIETWNKWVKNNLIEFPDNDNKLASKKTYLSNEKLEVGRSVIKIQTRKTVNYLSKLFNVKKIFNNPKPIELIKNLISLSRKDIIILDFFAGSATTADAVMQLNAEDGGNRQFIMVQLPEEIKEKENAYKEGYRYITEIGEERIRRAGAKIKEEHPEVDTGFKVFKVEE